MKLSQSKVTIYISIFLMLAAIGTFYFWSALSSGGVNFDLNVDGEGLVGEPFDLKVNFSNDSRNILNDAVLKLELPSNAVLVNGDQDKKIIERVVGSIDLGGAHQEIFKVMATPSDNPVAEFVVKLSYAPGTIAAHFEKGKTLKVDVKPIEIKLTLNAPEKVFSGEEFEISSSYGAINPRGHSKLFLKVFYPENFVKTSDNLEEETPTSGKFISSGRVSFPDEANFEIKSQVLTNLLGRDYVVAEKVSRVLISPSPLSLKVKVNDNENIVAHTADTLNYALVYRNNTEVGLQDINIKAKLTGEMFNFQTIDTKNAKLNLISRTITWNSNDFKELALLNPGEERTVNFSIKLRDSYPIRKLNDKNFILKVEANIVSPTVPYLVAADKTVNFASLETKVEGKIEVDSRGLFRDASAGIVNKGPWPPKVGQPTQYTIHWLLTNYASDVRNVEVHGSLEDGVVFVGTAKSNTSPPPEINSETGEIIWKIDRLVATTGITGEKPEAVFQIEATPILNKKGNYMPLFSSVKVKATDEFVGTEISNLSGSITTRLSHDPTISEDEGIVVE